MKKLRIFLLFAGLLAASMLSGCFDNREIDETAYIIAIGIDRTENSDFSYTFQFSKPISGGSPEGGESGGGGEGQSANKSVTNITVTAPDFYIAKNMTNNFLAKNIDMSHLKLIVFSKDIDPSGLSRHSQFLLREREIRPHTAVAVSKQTSREYMESVNPDLEANTAKYYELMALRSNNVYAPDKTLSDFVDEISTHGKASALPLAAIADKDSSSRKPQPDDGLWVSSESTVLTAKQSDFRGMAVFRDGVMTGTMNGDSAMLYNILNQNVQNAVITLRSPFNRADTFSFRLSVSEPARYAVDTSTKPCHISVSQALGIEFLGSKIPDGFESAEQLFAFVRSVIKSEMTKFFADISHNKRADILKIGDQFKKTFITQQQWEDANWSKIYETAKFNINIYFE